MSDKQHTQGSWVVRLDEERIGRVSVHCDALPKHSNCIAEMHCPYEDVVPNAYLISAAPELLNRCEEMLDLFSFVVVGDRAKDKATEFVDLLHNTVDKAKGK